MIQTQKKQNEIDEEFQILVRTLLPDIWMESKKSTCLKKKVGAILFDALLFGGVVVGRGNGRPTVKCLTCVRKELEWTQDGCWSIHSEMQALFHCFYNYGSGYDLSTSIAVVTHGPCDQCLKYLHYFGVKKVFYDIDYHNDYSKWEGKIEVIKIDRQEGDYEPDIS